MIKRLTWLLVGVILSVLIVSAVLIGGKVAWHDNRPAFSVLKVFAQQVQPTITPNSIIREENVYICGDIEEVARKPVGQELQTEKELKDNYAKLGFTVEILKDKILAQRKVDDFCSYHRSFRHLGVYQDKLAVYQGPLGYNQKLIKIEDKMPLNSLSADLQVKLQQAMDFYHMSSETQAKLRYELEFSNEDGLNAILENLDEMQD